MARPSADRGAGLQDLERLFSRYKLRLLAGRPLPPAEHFPADQAHHAMALPVRRAFQRFDLVDGQLLSARLKKLLEPSLRVLGREGS